MSKYQQSIHHDLSLLLNHLHLPDDPAGGALVVFSGEECVAEVSLGMAKPELPWSADTLAVNYSTGKGVLATLVHILVSAGRLDYDIPIAYYWPKFAANGKQLITPRSVLTHQAGLFDVQSLELTGDDILVWEQMLERVAAMPVARPVKLCPAAKRRLQKHYDHHSVAQGGDHPDTLHYQSVYSALVYGWVLGGLIESVTNQPLAQALQQYLTEPLKIDHACFFGVPADRLDQVAQLPKEPVEITEAMLQQRYQQLDIIECWRKRAKAVGLDDLSDLSTAQISRLYFDPRLMDLEAYKAALSLAEQSVVDYRSSPYLQACIPAANGVASAKSLAIIYAMLANGGHWRGKTLIDPVTFAELSKIHVTGMDAVMPAVGGAGEVSIASMNWRLGYHRIPNVCQDAQTVFGHMGYNGSVAWCDPSKALAAAYIHNHEVTMFSDVRQFVFTEAILAAADRH